jgi:hypothetical protein
MVICVVFLSHCNVDTADTGGYQACAGLFRLSLDLIDEKLVSL